MGVFSALFKVYDSDAGSYRLGVLDELFTAHGFDGPSLKIETHNTGSTSLGILNTFSHRSIKPRTHQPGYTQKAVGHSILVACRTFDPAGWVHLVAFKWLVSGHVKFGLGILNTGSCRLGILNTISYTLDILNGVSMAHESDAGSYRLGILNDL